MNSVVKLSDRHTSFDSVVIGIGFIGRIGKIITDFYWNGAVKSLIIERKSDIATALNEFC